MGGMSDPGKSAAERLATQVQYLKGVGPRRAEMLERLGLRTVADVLFFFPRDYEDHTDRRQVADLEEGSLQSVRGLVEEVEMRDLAPGRNMLGMLVRVGSGHIRAVWFNQPFLLLPVPPRAGGARFGQAEAARPDVANGPSAGDDPGRR